MSVPLVSFLAAACGTGDKGGGGGGGGADTAVKAGGKQVEVKPGGTLKLGMSPGPSTEIDPIKVADEGGLGVMSQTGEFLGLVGQQAAAPAAPGRELEAELRRQRVDVQDPPGRQVP